MARQKFVTKIRTISAEKSSDYVMGVINGVEYSLCKKDGKHYCHVITDKLTGEVTMINECTRTQYAQFSKVIEELFPGLCDFDI